MFLYCLSILDQCGQTRPSSLIEATEKCLREREQMERERLAQEKIREEEVAEQLRIRILCVHSLANAITKVVVIGFRRENNTN